MCWQWGVCGDHTTPAGVRSKQQQPSRVVQVRQLVRASPVKQPNRFPASSRPATLPKPLSRKLPWPHTAPEPLSRKLPRPATSPATRPKPLSRKLFHTPQTPFPKAPVASHRPATLPNPHSRKLSRKLSWPRTVAQHPWDTPHASQRVACRCRDCCKAKRVCTGQRRATSPQTRCARWLTRHASHRERLQPHSRRLF